MLPAGLASAQADAGSNEQIAAARALFETGLTYGNQGQWTEAVDHFRRSVALYPSPNASFNLAYALTQLGVVGYYLQRHGSAASSAMVRTRRLPR